METANDLARAAAAKTASMAPQFLAEIRAARSILVGTHLNPDGDALGSALALSHALDAMGAPHEVVCHHGPPRNLRFLPGVERLRTVPTADSHDLGIMLDLESPERLGSLQPAFERCRRIMVVDHHVPHQEPGDVRIVETTACATAAILTELLVAAGTKITPEIATCLLTGIVTDTGSFRFRNTNAQAMNLAALLLEHGADLETVSVEIFQRKPLSSMRLLGHLLDNIVLDPDGRLAYSFLEHEDFVRTGARDEDTEGFVNEILSIETVQVAAFLREPRQGLIRCSLRSRGSYDVAAVGRHFGGGGHKNAAGLTLEAPMPDAIDQVVAELRKCLASS